MSLTKRVLTCAIVAVLETAGVATAQVAPSTARDAAALDDFSGFSRAQIIRDLYTENMSSLRRDKVATFIYLLPIIEALDNNDAWYRIGQDMEALLDARLAPAARWLSVTDRDIFGTFVQSGKNIATEFLGEWVSERRQQVDKGIIDPLGENIAVNRGLLRGAAALAGLRADAALDARKLMLLARNNPAAFLKAYNGIRKFIYAY